MKKYTKNQIIHRIFQKVSHKKVVKHHPYIEPFIRFMTSRPLINYDRPRFTEMPFPFITETRFQQLNNEPRPLYEVHPFRSEPPIVHIHSDFSPSFLIEFNFERFCLCERVVWRLFSVPEELMQLLINKVFTSSKSARFRWIVKIDWIQNFDEGNWKSWVKVFVHIVVSAFHCRI